MRRSDKSGILSVYETPTCLNTEKTDGVYRVIRPLKCFKNLVTEVRSVSINNDNTLVVYASEDKKDQVRVIHLPSLSVYSNWPAVNEKLGFIRDVSISGDNRSCGEGALGVEYLAMAGKRGKVYLYRFNHFYHCVVYCGVMSLL